MRHVIVEYEYPGDPLTIARLTFGAEFLAENPNRYTAVTTFTDINDIRPPREDEKIYIGDEIICDLCNASVQPSDPCSLVLNSLYCWDCHTRVVMPHAKRTLVVENPEVGDVR